MHWGARSWNGKDEVSGEGTRNRSTANDKENQENVGPKRYNEPWKVNRCNTVSLVVSLWFVKKQRCHVSTKQLMQAFALVYLFASGKSKERREGRAMYLLKHRLFPLETKHWIWAFSSLTIIFCIDLRCSYVRK